MWRMRQKHLPILIWLGKPADDKSKSQSRSRTTRCAIFFDFSVLNSWKGSLSAVSYVLDRSQARWKSSGKMIAAHSAPIRFTEVQPSCRTTRRRERNRREGVGSGRRRWCVCVGGKERFWTRIGTVAAGQRWSNLIWREIKRPPGYSDLQTTAALVRARIPSAESENAAVSDGRRARLRPAAASAQEPVETLLRHTESPDTTATVSTVLCLRYSLYSVGKVSGMFRAVIQRPLQTCPTGARMSYRLKRGKNR